MQSCMLFSLLAEESSRLKSWEVCARTGCMGVSHHGLGINFMGRLYGQEQGISAPAYLGVGTGFECFLSSLTSQVI